jgi:hypothetical protein
MFTLINQRLAACRLALRDPRQLSENRVFSFCLSLLAVSYSRTPPHDTGRVGCCDLVFRDLSATPVTGDLQTGPSPELLASCDAAFSCLLQLGGRSEVEAAGRRNVVNGETLPVSRLIELARDLGLEAEHVLLDWQRLQALGFDRPLLVLHKNAHVILVTGEGRDKATEVAVWDPRNPYGETLFIPRQDFEQASTGHVLIITSPRSDGAGAPAFSDFCWFTSAGLELLDRMPGRGKSTKRRSQGRQESGTHPKPALPRTERAIADTGRGLSPLIRFCVVTAGILAAAAGGTFLFRSSITDPVATAIAFAKDVWAVAPDGTPPTDGRAENVPRASSAPIPEAPPAAALGEPGASAPPTKPAAPRSEHTGPRLATRSVPAITGSHVAAPQAAPAVARDDVPASVTTTAKRRPIVFGAMPAPMPEVAAPPVAPQAVAPRVVPAATPAPVPEVAAPPVPPQAVAPRVVPAATPAPVPEVAAPAVPAQAVAPRVIPAATPAPVPEVAAPAVPPQAVAPRAIPAATSEARAPSATTDAAPEAAAATAKSGLEGSAAPNAKNAVPPLPPASDRLSDEEMAALLARGDTLLSVGDVTSARLFYERVANAGGGLAAIRLGETFDPLFLDRVHMRGVRGDPAAAEFWYHRARDLGATDAEVLLKALNGR